MDYRAPTSAKCDDNYRVYLRRSGHEVSDVIWRKGNTRRSLRPRSSYRGLSAESRITPMNHKSTTVE